MLDQSQYLRTVLARYRRYIKAGRRPERVPKTPLPAKMVMRRGRMEDETVSLPYRELLGSIGHLAIGTRIDISFAVSLLSRFTSRPLQEHWDAAIHVLKYLAGQEQIGLVFNKGPKKNEFDPKALNQDNHTSQPHLSILTSLMILIQLSRSAAW